MEVQSEAEADEAIDAGADIVMLDNLEGPSTHFRTVTLGDDLAQCQGNRCTRQREI